MTWSHAGWWNQATAATAKDAYQAFIRDLKEHKNVSECEQYPLTVETAIRSHFCWDTAFHLRTTNPRCIRGAGCTSLSQHRCVLARLTVH